MSPLFPFTIPTWFSFWVSSYIDYYFRPIHDLSNIIWIIGDVFDEGQWVDEAEFTSYVNRFYSLFPFTSRLYVIVGNHDVGFHYV